MKDQVTNEKGKEDWKVFLLTSEGILFDEPNNRPDFTLANTGISYAVGYKEENGSDEIIFEGVNV